MDRLVIEIDPVLKKRFLAQIKTTGTSMSFVVRKLLTDYITKEAPNVVTRKRGRPRKDQSLAGGSPNSYC